MRPETVKTWCKSKKTQKYTFLSKSQDVEFVELLHGSKPGFKLGFRGGFKRFEGRPA